MKYTIGFVAALILIVFTGWVTKDINLASVTLRKHYIAPVSEWSSILNGGWNWERETTSKSFKRVENGKIFFNSDNTFSLYVTIQFYEYKEQSHTYQEESYRICSGSTNGIYSIGNESFTLNFTKCNLTSIKNTQEDDYVCCKSYSSLILGKTKKVEYPITEFNNNVISCEGYQYSDASNIKVALTK